MTATRTTFRLRTGRLIAGFRTDGTYGIKGTISAGTHGTRSNRTNAGDLGFIWTFTTEDGVKIHGVPDTDLEAMD